MLVKDKYYNYSYILSENSIKVEIKNYNIKKINNWNLYYSNDMDFYLFEDNNTQILLLGYALDIRNGKLSVSKILENLSNSAEIDKELDYINGRYILIVNRSNKITVYTDASALLPINYFEGKTIISSHDVLIYDVLKDNNIFLEPVQSELKGSFDFTRYHSIYKFNPSLKLNLEPFEFNRYYPKETIKQLDIDSIIEELEIYFDEMISWLDRVNKKIILTLTGGYDSRVSMALTNSISDKVEYITYIHPNIGRLSIRAQEIYNTDIYITQKIASNLNINHSLVDLSNYNLKGEERDSALQSLQTTHSFPLIDYFRNKRHFSKALHIKSTVFGMGKSDFPLNKNHAPSTKKEMSNFIHGVSKAAQRMIEYEDIIEAYYKRNLVEENVGKGRHFFEIFHLESRMANWHSNVTQETDPELIDFVFVNTRRIIDLIQSPSIQERKDKILYKTLIQRYWPALLFIGVNDKTINLDYAKIGLSNIYINGMKIYEISNLSFKKNTDTEILIKPNSKIVGPQNQYVFKSKNNTHYSKEIKIKSLFNKEKSRNYINVKIMKLDNKTFTSIDIVDLFEGYEVTLKPFQELMIRIDYNHVFDKISWKNAGQIIISNI